MFGERHVSMRNGSYPINISTKPVVTKAKSERDKLSWGNEVHNLCLRGSGSTEERSRCLGRTSSHSIGA